MARSRAAQTDSLKHLVKSARAGGGFIVYRGSLDQHAPKGEVILHPHLSPTREWAAFKAKDLVGKPVLIPAAERAPRERSHDIAELAVRRGAPFRHVQEWLYRVGTHGAPRGIALHHLTLTPEERERIDAAAADYV